MSTYLGLTGSPGTGKKTLAPLIAAKLQVPFYDLNVLAKTYGLINRKAEADVDASELGSRVAAEVKGPCLLFGHLLPYAFRRGTFSRVVVLRCDPGVLRRRLSGRGYSESKISENLEAELIGVIAADATRSFGRGRVSEVDATSAPPRRTAARAARFLGGKEPAEAPIDWLTSYGSATRLRTLFGTKPPAGIVPAAYSRP